MLIDEVTIKVKAGDGGDGRVHFYHDKHRPKGGPDGGTGGDGGSLFFKAVSDITRLQQFRFPKVFTAEDGQPGGMNQSTGRNGQDLVLEVPVGTVVTYDNGTSLELSEVGMLARIAKGGRGGRGNYSYRSSTNQTPREADEGQKRPIRNLNLKLKLIADIGLIGLPNAGKTSLLNELTSANAKVANYAFTTLEPNLGVMKGDHILADIPGLIEGASEGRGLGYKFLRHVERTRILLHCISAESADPLADYKTVRHEMENYSTILIKKPEIIIITKSDLLPSAQIKLLQKQLKAKLAVSIIDQDSLKKLADLLTANLTPKETPGVITGGEDTKKISQ